MKRTTTVKIKSGHLLFFIVSDDARQSTFGVN